MRYIVGPLLLAGLGCTLGCTRPQPVKLAVDPSLARLVPVDTILLTGVRVQELRATPLYRKLESRGGAGVREMTDLLAKSGFDVNKDVSALLIASNGVSTIIMAKGSFKIATLDALRESGPKSGSKSASGRKSEYKGRAIYGDGDGSFTLLDDSTAVAGSAASVRAAIDLAAAGGASGHPLLAAAASLPVTSQIWAVGTDLGVFADRYVPREGNLANARRLLKSTKSVTLSADMTTGVKASIAGTCASDQDAKLLNDTLRGILGLGRLSVPEERRELLRLYDGVKVERRDLTIHLEIDQPAELLDKLIDMFAPPASLGLFPYPEGGAA